MTMLGPAGHCIFGIAASGTTGTDKITHTVGGKRVIIIRKITFLRATSDYLSVFNPT
jgi:hypothetical protein